MFENEKQSESSINKDFVESDKLAILTNRIRLQIILYLLIFGELSMSEINKKLKKSKATIHRHIKILKEKNIVILSREKKVRGSIKAKHYRLKDEFLSLFELQLKKILFKTDNLEIRDIKFEHLIHLFQFAMIIIKKPIEIFSRILDFYFKDIDVNYQQFYREMKKINSSINIMFLTESQFTKLNEKLKDFHSMLNNLALENKNQSNNIKRSYMFTSYLVNLNRLLELGNKY
jgi:DNA-binding transcriptional ArsR family regulator